MAVAASKGRALQLPNVAMMGWKTILALRIFGSGLIAPQVLVPKTLHFKIRRVRATVWYWARW